MKLNASNCIIPFHFSIASLIACKYYCSSLTYQHHKIACKQGCFEHRIKSLSQCSGPQMADLTRYVATEPEHDK